MGTYVSAGEADYNVILARQYLKEGNLDKAKAAVSNGLEVSPADTQLKELKRKIELAEEGQREVIARNKKASQEDAKIKAKASERERIAAKAKAAVERPVKLQKTYCDCLERNTQLQKTIDSENEAAKYSGMVRKDILYSAGKQIFATKKMAELIASDLKALNLAIPNCGDFPKNTPGGNLCLEYQIKNLGNGN